MRIGKNSPDDKLVEEIASERAKLEKWESLKNSYDVKIRASSAKIERLESILKNRKLSAAESVLEIKGLSLNDVFSAINSNDFTALQEVVNAANLRSSDDVLTNDI